MLRYICLLLCLIHLNSYSQGIVITATILDEQKMPVLGNVMLLDTTNTIITGNYFDDGTIRLVTTYKGKSIYKIISTGYESFEKEIILQNENIELGNIYLKQQPNVLTAITVTAQKPMFEKTIDGTRINIENSLLSKSANANELLNKIPTVNVTGNKVNVFGRGEALLIMNGREITFESFKSLPPSDIKSIEVVTNPDARYDAKGKAVIIITMQKHFSQGISSTLVNTNTTGIIKNAPIGKYMLNAPNITLNYRKDKWDLSTYYANELGTSWSENNFITTAENFKKIGYYTEDNHSTSVHYYRLGIGYKLNENISLSTQYDGLSHFFNLDVMQNGDYYNNDKFVTKIHMINDATTRLQNHSANTNYYQKINEQGSSLFIGVQFNQFQNKLLDNITEHIDTSIYNRINDNLNTIHLYTAQSDYIHKTKNGGFDFGAKFSHTTNDGNIQFFTKSESETNFNQSLLNKIIYKEYVPALYAIYKQTWKKIYATIGLRWEHTIANSNSLSSKITYFDTSYSNFFPSAKLIHSFSDNWKMSISYNYKINRPLYQDMDPFLWYLDSLTSIQGNSQLKPEYLNQGEARLMFKNFVLRYGYTLSKKIITPVMMRNWASPSENAVVFTKDNIQQRTLHNIALEIPFESSNYITYNTLAINVFQFKDGRKEYQALQSMPKFYLYSYHSYKIPKWFTAEFTAEYYSSSFNGFTKLQPYYYFTIAISRSFLKNNALNIGLMWNDFARTAVWAGKFTAGSFSNEYYQRFTVDYLRLTITYNLSSKTIFNYKNKNVNESEFNRIKK